MTCMFYVLYFTLLPSYFPGLIAMGCFFMIKKCLGQDFTRSGVGREKLEAYMEGAYRRVIYPIIVTGAYAWVHMDRIIDLPYNPE